MPAHHVESDDAEAEGAVFELLVNPTEVMTSDGKVVGVKLQKMQLGEPDASGRRSPQPVPGSEYVRECDLVISTIGMSPDAALYATMAGVARSDRIKVDPVTLQSDIPYLFAAGDVTTGATDITVIAPSNIQHPPDYGPKASDLAALSDADYVVLAGFEGFADRMTEAAGTDAEVLTITPDYAPDKVAAEVDKLAEAWGTTEVADENVEDAHYHLRERRYGSFSRSLRFPVDVNAEAIEATYQNGVLSLNVPKAEEVKPKQISIKVNA